MKVNFRVNGNEIGSNNIWYDLHNRFHFKGFSWDAKQNLLCLAFTPLEKWKIESDEPIIFLFEHVDFFKTCSIVKDKCFEEAGYKYSSDFEYDWFLTEEESDSFDHLIFWFEEGGYIRVHSTTGMLIKQREFESNDEFRFAQSAFGF